MSLQRGYMYHEVHYKARLSGLKNQICEKKMKEEEEEVFSLFTASYLAVYPSPINWVASNAFSIDFPLIPFLLFFP